MMDEAKSKVSELQTFLSASQSNQDQFDNYLSKKGWSQHLEFVWAVEGIKNPSFSRARLEGLVRIIEDQLLNKLCISESVRRSVKNKIASRDFSQDIFDEAKDEVWNALENVLYRDFQSSNYEANKIIGQSTSSKDDPVIEKILEKPELLLKNSPLDAEQDIPQQSSSSSDQRKPRKLEPLEENTELRNKILEAAQECGKNLERIRGGDKELMPAGSSTQKPEFPYHSSNLSRFYKPRQNSDTQSLSSGCFSEASLDSQIKPKCRKEKQQQQATRPMSLPNVGNVDETDMRFVASSDPMTFADMLAERLQKVVLSPDEEPTKYDIDSSQLAHDLRRLVARDKKEDTPPEAILDDHCSRVWPESGGESFLSSPERRKKSKKVKDAVNAAMRPRTSKVQKDDGHKVSKVRASTSSLKYDSGISVTTASNFDEQSLASSSSVVNNPQSTKVTAAKGKKKDMKHLVYLGDA